MKFSIPPSLNGHEAIIDALRRAPDIVVPLVREVPAEILKRRPSPKRWSAHEHACHLAHLHSLFFDRLESMLREPASVIRPYLPGEQDSDDLLLNMNLAEALEHYIADRSRLVARLRQLTATDWARTAQHGEYHAYSVFILFRHLSLHDFWHAYRIEELLLQRTGPSDLASASGPTLADVELVLELSSAGHCTFLRAYAV